MTDITGAVQNYANQTNQIAVAWKLKYETHHHIKTFVRFNEAENCLASVGTVIDTVAPIEYKFICIPEEM